MKKQTQQSIFLVDDEDGILRVASGALKKNGYNVACFTNAEMCLEQLPHQGCNLLITDVKMPGMDGLALMRKTMHIAPWVSVMVMTGYGDIPMAVRAMKMGAVDFVQKPLNRGIFLGKVKAVLDKVSRANSAAGDALTKTEKKVLKLILDGMSNKEMAYKLQRNIRTIEFHRRNVMRKFGADNVVDLVKKTASFDFSID